MAKRHGDKEHFKKLEQQTTNGHSLDAKTKAYIVRSQVYPQTPDGVIRRETLEQAKVRSGLDDNIQADTEDDNNDCRRHSDSHMLYMISNMREKISNNLDHYLYQVGLPLLFRHKDSRSRSSSRERHRKHSRGQRRNQELIPQGDIDDFVLVENIELSHMDTYVIGSKKEVGKGHDFESVSLTAPSWCDQCGDFIWGVYKECLSCKHCRLTCHHKCRPNVSLDCNSTAQDNLEENNKDRKKSPVKRRQSGRADDADSGYHTGESTLRDHTPGELTLTREELRKNIDAFNDNQHGLIMTLNEETATFQGFIRVHMNLMRPISMSLPSRPTSIYDVVGSDCDSDEPPCETLTTSFYLPKDTTKVIHISSATTTQDVIKALLQKFKITDNPRKFALYEKIENEGAKATMRRLLNEEKPLPLCLSWTAEGLESHKYVLQENEPGEIVWEAFSIPELENFLKILDREEDEYVDQMKAKYKLLKIQIERQMKTLLAEGETQSASCTAGPPGGSHTSFDGDSREPVYV